MKVAHVLRKYNPLEWAGTETALQRLVQGLKEYQINSVVFCPQLQNPTPFDPLLEEGYSIKRFRACVPVWGISTEQKRQMIAMGGNLMSFDLPLTLRKEESVSVVHTHTLGRIGAIANAFARSRKLPFVVSIHGGVMDLPLKSQYLNSASGKSGIEWGKIFGLIFDSRNLLNKADAIITYNQTEADLLRQKYPHLNVLIHHHGVSIHDFKKNHRKKARSVFPQIRDRKLIVCLARIDPVKNQLWLIKQAPYIFKKHPDALIFFIGSSTNAVYAKQVADEISKNNLSDRIILTGNLPPGDPQLIGLLQEAKVLVLPSIAEPFGLVIIEAWAAGTIVLSSKTSGPASLIESGKNGWLFSLEDPAGFHEMLDKSLNDPEIEKQFRLNGDSIVRAKYSTTAIAGEMKKLYEQLINKTQNSIAA